VTYAVRFGKDKSSGGIEGLSPIALYTTRHGGGYQRLLVSKPNAADMQSLTFVDALMAELKRVSQDDSAI